MTDKVSVTLSRHDQFQLEAKIIYPLISGQRVCDYSVDMFFFLPRNLAVNSSTFGAREFYNDFSEYVRFKTPTMRLADLVRPDNQAFRSLAGAAAGLPGTAREFERRLKMFCSIARSSLRDDARQISKLSPEKQLPEIESYLSNVTELLKLFRSLHEQVDRNDLYPLVDEYLSIISCNYIYNIWNTIEKSSFPYPEKLKQKMVRLSHEETVYRKNCGYPSVPDNERDNSEMLYRESVLKKAMASILFLSVATRRDGLWIENLFMGLAAAVAMIFVTAVAFIWQGFKFEEFSLSFFIVWVIAYMFKDRIKFILQNYCLSKRSRYSYDYRQSVFDGLGNKVGVFHEGFRYCDASDLEHQILEVRNRTMLSRLENGSLEENVLVYRKKLELSGNACRDIFQEFNIDGVVNIYRLNIHHWLNKMDNPIKKIHNSDGTKIYPLPARRDYHVNIVIRINSRGSESKYVRCRMVLCRSGIRRLEMFKS